MGSLGDCSDSNFIKRVLHFQKGMNCHSCGQRIKFGQSRLTDSEKHCYNWSGDPNGSPNIIEAQCVKACAQWYGVEDWTAYWDPILSVEENYNIMAKEGSQRPGKSMREMKGEYYG